MSKSKTNILTHGYHGKMGDQFVYRVRGRESIMAAKPETGNIVPTQAQIDQRKRFSGAANYAKVALQDPVLKLVYQAKATKLLTAYNAAMADFLKKPWIDQIDATAYTGQVGDKITVIAADNGKVSSLTLSIRDGAGVQLEGGNCVQDPLTTNWVYTATTTQVPVTGHKIVAIVRDLPGHVTEKELVL